jgi:hypothetical protein
MIILFIHNQKGAEIGAFFGAQKYFAKIAKNVLTNNKNCDTMNTRLKQGARRKGKVHGSEAEKPGAL